MSLFVVVTLLSSQVVHKKTATALCLTSVKNEDKLELSKIVEAVKVITLLHTNSVVNTLVNKIAVI